MAAGLGLTIEVGFDIIRVVNSGREIG